MARPWALSRRTSSTSTRASRVPPSDHVPEICMGLESVSPKPHQTPEGISTASGSTRSISRPTTTRWDVPLQAVHTSSCRSATALSTSRPDEPALETSSFPGFPTAVPSATRSERQAESNSTSPSDNHLIATPSRQTPTRETAVFPPGRPSRVRPCWSRTGPGCAPGTR